MSSKEERFSESVYWHRMMWQYCLQGDQKFRNQDKEIPITNFALTIEHEGINFKKMVGIL